MLRFAGCAMRSGTRPMCRGSLRHCRAAATDSSLQWPVLPSWNSPQHLLQEIEDRRETSRAPDPPARPTQTRIQRPVLVAASILVVSPCSLGVGLRALATSGFSVHSIAHAIHAGRASLREPDWRSRAGVHQRRDDRRADRAAWRDGSVTSGSHRQAVGDAVQEDDQTSRPDWFRPGREPPARGKPAEDRKPHPHCRAADRHRERESALGRTVRARRDGPVGASTRSCGGHYPPDHDEFGRRAFERLRRCETAFDERRGVRALSTRASSPLATEYRRGVRKGQGAFSESHRPGRFLRTRLQWPGRYVHDAR